MQVPNNRTGFKTFGHSKVAMIFGRVRLEMVRLWEHMRACVTKGEGRGIEPEGEEPPPLVGESEVLYRTVYSFGVLHSKDRTVVV